MKSTFEMCKEFYESITQKIIEILSEDYKINLKKKVIVFDDMAYVPIKVKIECDDLEVYFMHFKEMNGYNFTYTKGNKEKFLKLERLINTELLKRDIFLLTQENKFLKERINSLVVDIREILNKKEQDIYVYKGNK